jgi:glucosamine kinase
VRYALGIDAGASSAKWAVLNERLEIMASGRTSPFTGHVFSEVQQQQNFAALQALLEAVQGFEISSVLAGITGLTLGDEAALFYQQALSESFSLEPSSVAIMSDMDLAYLSHFEPGEGILVYAGTGSIAWHIRADGTTARAGGRGYLIGDHGGGFSIGQQALEFVTTLIDVSDQPEQHALARAVFEHIGSSDWSTVREYVYGGGHSAVAALAPVVGQVAARGDVDAQKILERAGEDLSALAQRLMRRVGILPIVLTGGALRVSPIVGDSATRALRNLEARVVDSDFAMMAAKMAMEGLSDEQS